ncbi:hypothetical protein [Oceanobacillus oncorhynchi]|uniref:hypothetical protein n=1 Tax=Oceanobacillus oncorhynchi TaxID=545501 RepID=UPI0034D4CF71
MGKENKKLFQLALNEINESEDPTKVECTFIILDFEKSLNNTIIPEDVAMSDLSPNIKSKPIVGHYEHTDKNNPNNDNFTGHEAFIDEDKHGDLYIGLDTVPMGTFTTEGYVETIQVDGENRKVLMADAVLWKDRFPEAIGLLQDWNARGLNINTSCEILYSNYSVNDGVETINSPVFFSGHCLLASEDRGDLPTVAPAYQVSRLVEFSERQKFKKLVAQAANQEEEEERNENVDKFKKVFELSHNDIRTAIYKVFDPTLDSNQESFIRDVYDNKVIIEIDTFTDVSFESKQYQYDYTKNSDDTVIVDLDSKTEVMKKTEWVQLNEVKELQKQLDDKDGEIKSLNEASEALKTEKSELEAKFNDATESIVQLNSKVKELEPFKEKVDATELEKQLNDKQEFYSAKFEALDAKEKFSSDKVQELVKKSINDSDAVVQLNSMLVELVTKSNDKNEPIRQENQKREDLIPDSNDFDSRYSI